MSGFPNMILSVHVCVCATKLVSLTSMSKKRANSTEDNLNYAISSGLPLVSWHSAIPFLPSLYLSFCQGT